MNDISQVVATGGAGTLLSAAVFLLYKFFSGNRRIRSSCCGAETSFSIAETSSDKNIAVAVENDTHDSGRKEVEESHPRGRTGSTNERRVSEERSTRPQGERRQSTQHAREDSGVEPVP